MTLVTAEGAGLVDFAIIPHVEYDDHQDMANAEKAAMADGPPTAAMGKASYLPSLGTRLAWLARSASSAP
jgi:hypothetical protein